MPQESLVGFVVMNLKFTRVSDIEHDKHYVKNRDTQRKSLTCRQSAVKDKSAGRILCRGIKMPDTDERFLPDDKEYSIVRLDAGYPPDSYEAEKKMKEVDDLEAEKGKSRWSDNRTEVSYYAHDAEGNTYSLDED